MSGTGNCYDNAVAESFFTLLRQNMSTMNHLKVEKKLKEVFYNRERMHSFLGYLSPEEYEKQWCKAVI